MSSDQSTPTRRNRGWWRTDAFRRDVTARYTTDGQSVRRIAADLGCAYSTVHQVLALANVAMRPRGGSRKHPGTEPTRRTGNRLNHRVRAAIWAVIETAAEHTEQARDDVAGGLLADELSRFDPEAVRPEECLVEAAIAYAAASGVHDTDAVLPWARYAYDNGRRLYPAGHAQIVSAAEMYVAALEVAGDRFTAILIQRELVALLPAGHHETGRCRLDLVRALHDTGDCREALREASTLLDVLTSRQPILDVDAALLVRSVAAMQTGCHQHDLAAQTAALTTPGYVHGELDGAPGYAHLAVGWRRDPVEHAATWHPGQVCEHLACPITPPAPRPSHPPAPRSSAPQSALPAAVDGPARQEVART